MTGYYRNTGVPGVQGYYCGACKGSHAKQETVRKCYADYYAVRGMVQNNPAVAMRNLSIPQNKVGGYIVETERPPWMSLEDSNEIPSGNYLVLVRAPAAKITDPARNEKYIHIRVGVLDEGKWANFYFVSIYDEEARKLVPVRDTASRAEIISKMRSGNWRMFLMSYGRAFAECPICERPLDKSEINSGVHKAQECYDKVYGG